MAPNGALAFHPVFNWSGNQLKDVKSEELMFVSHKRCVPSRVMVHLRSETVLSLYALIYEMKEVINELTL